MNMQKSPPCARNGADFPSSGCGGNAPVSAPAGTPAVSVIVPVYNVEKYLAECVESVLAQTFADFELILVDDGSPDRSGELCDAFAKKDPRVRVFHKRNGGVVSARMHGLARAGGEYVIFLDGDDFWTQTALAGLYNVAKKHDADFVRGGFFYISEEEKISSVVQPALRGAFSVSGLLSHPFRTIFDYTAMCVGGNLYRKNTAERAAEDVGNVNINHSEDGLFAAAAFLRSNTIAFSRDPFYYYKQRQGSALHRYNPRVVEAEEAFCEAMKKILVASERVPENRVAEIVREHEFASLAYIFHMLLKAPNLFSLRALQKELLGSRLFADLRASSRFASSTKLKRKLCVYLLSSKFAMQILYCAKKVTTPPQSAGVRNNAQEEGASFPWVFPKNPSFQFGAILEVA